MENLDTGKDKIQKICDSLRKETLEPAKHEAGIIVEEAKARASQIIKDAEEQADRIHAQAKAEVEQERNVFQSSLAQAAKQSIEALKQDVESKIFNDELENILTAEVVKPNVVANLIAALIKAVEDEGIDADLEAVIPKSVSPKDVSKLLGESVVSKLKDHKISIGNFDGGAQLKILGKKITIDITDSTLKELMASYVRKDFRKMVFAN